MNKFGRKAEFYIEDRILKYPDLEIEFDISFDTNSNGNTGNIKFYNLSDKSIKALRKGNIFRLLAGYNGDIGLLMYGTIEKSTSKFENGQKVTECVLNDNTDKWINKFINLTWTNRTRASKIAQDIISQIPLELGDFEINNDIRYFGGKTISATAKKGLEEIAKDTNTKLHISNGKIYFRPEGKANRRTIKINKDTGLIASPQRIDSKNEERWKVQFLLNYKIQADTVLDIDSLTLRGLYRVVEGSHSGDFTTEVEVVKYEN